MQANQKNLGVGRAPAPIAPEARASRSASAPSVHGNRYYIVAKCDCLSGKVWRAGEMVLTKTGRPRSFKTHGLALAFKSANDYGSSCFRVAYGWELTGGLS